jgi:hypothetical protein
MTDMRRESQRAMVLGMAGINKRRRNATDVMDGCDDHGGGRGSGDIKSDLVLVLVLV